MIYRDVALLSRGSSTDDMLFFLLDRSADPTLKARLHPLPSSDRGRKEKEKG
jgi:hypothetical protein